MQFKSILVSAALSLSLLSTASLANSWQLDSDNSVLNFVSVKNDHVAETHRFTELQGVWEDNQVTIEIPVVSLDTEIPIRNERMLEHLFKSNDFPIVTAKAALEHSLLLELPVGATLALPLKLNIYIAGETESVATNLQISRLANERFLATTTQPIVINAKAFGFVQGIDTLRELAGLSRIDYSVPVTFSVQFTR